MRASFAGKFGIAAALCLVAPLVHAQATPDAQSTTEPALVWHAPAGCPTDSEILQQVARLLRRAPPMSPTPEGFHAEASVAEASATEFEASVAINRSDEMRVIRGESCEAIAEAVTIMITIAIDPNADVVLDSFHEATRESDTTTTSVTPPPPTQLIPAREPFELRIDAGGGVSTGVLPGLAPGLTLSTSVRASLFVIHAGFSYLFPQGESAFSVGTFSMMRGELAGGFAFSPRHGPLWIELLVALELAAIRGESRGIDQSTTGTGLWFGAGLATRLRYQLGSTFGLYLAFAAISAFDRPSFDVTGLGTVFRSSGLSARADAGLFIRFDL